MNNAELFDGPAADTPKSGVALMLRKLDEIEQLGEVEFAMNPDALACVRAAVANSRGILDQLKVIDDALDRWTGRVIDGMSDRT